jgi:hypothetical protein
MLVRITLLLNLLAVVVVIAVILQLELPGGDDLAKVAGDAWARLESWAQAVRPWAEAALDRLSDWVEAAWTWTAEQVDQVRDWVTDTSSANS